MNISPSTGRAKITRPDVIAAERSAAHAGVILIHKASFTEQTAKLAALAKATNEALAKALEMERTKGSETPAAFDVQSANEAIMVAADELIPKEAEADAEPTAVG